MFIIILKIYPEQISIGILPPYTRNESPETLLFNNHFPFELVFNYETGPYNLNIINIDLLDTESEYIKICKEEVIQRGIDYLLYSTVYSNNSFLYFKVQLINPYNDEIIILKLYKFNMDYTINESLTKCTKNIINIINNKKIEKIKYKLKEATKDKDLKEEEEFDFIPFREKYKHEIFFLNGFFKNHTGVMSFIEFNTGYGFSPFDFLKIEGGFFLGIGHPDTDINLKNIGFKNFYIGPFAAMHFVIAGFILEPSFGLRFEIVYIINDSLAFSFPIDAGLKINVTAKNCIRLNASFQFMRFNFFNLSWENNFVIGFQVGYAQKF